VQSLTNASTPVIPEDRMRKRGKYGLTGFTYTCKIGCFLPFYSITTTRNRELVICSPAAAGISEAAQAAAAGS